MIPLYYSVLAYLVPAALASGTWIGTSIFLLTPIAVLNHAKFHEDYKGKRLVMYTDRILTHAIAIGLCLTALQFNFFKALPFWICLAYTAISFHYLKRKATTDTQRRNIHASMHAISALGIIYLILARVSVLK